jgi:hypothetical protein
MVWFVRIVAALLSDAFKLVLLLLRSSAAICAENLVLRKQLAQYVERGIKPRRVDFVTRIGLALLTRLFDWQNAVVNRASENDHPLAPYGMAIVLAIQVQTWPTADSDRTAGADS